MTPYWESPCGSYTLYHGQAEYIVSILRKVEAVITDPPYSERTHSGHDATAQGYRGEGFDGSNRQSLGYEAWGRAEIDAFIPMLCDHCTGWVVTMTDHFLVIPIQSAMESTGRYAFAPLPWYVPGSRVRLAGDGPSSWTAWIVASRTAAQSKWGTLPGGYMQSGKQYQMGGKPVELMTALVKDYSRHSDTVLDPFAGSCTTGIACIRTGRKFIGIERDQSACDLAIGLLERELRQPFLPNLSPSVQGELSDGTA